MIAVERIYRMLTPGRSFGAIHKAESREGCLSVSGQTSPTADLAAPCALLA